MAILHVKHCGYRQIIDVYICKSIVAKKPSPSVLILLYYWWYEPHTQKLLGHQVGQHYPMLISHHQRKLVSEDGNVGHCGLIGAMVKPLFADLLPCTPSPQLRLVPPQCRYWHRMRCVMKLQIQGSVFVSLLDIERIRSDIYTDC